MIEIKDRYTERVIYSSDKAKDIKECLEEAVKVGANLQGANLQGANLQDANLQGANLQGANLQYANLQGAKLQYAKLQYAPLQYANLQGANLQGANLQGANLQGANLQGANLQYANLQGAKLQYAKLQYAPLQYANLQGANLQGANLQGANLQDANLQYANLQYAKLQGAKDFNKFKVQPLLMLLDQPGKLRFYKAVTKDLCSPTSDTIIRYKIGNKVSVEDANTDEHNLCAAGINVATLDWILKEYRNIQVRILMIECTANDIACIPVASDGKIRLHRGKVVAELDYERYGLKNPMETANSIVTGD